MRFLVSNGDYTAPWVSRNFNIVQAMRDPIIKHLFLVCGLTASYNRGEKFNLTEKVDEYRKQFPRAGEQDYRDFLQVWTPPASVVMNRLEVALAMSMDFDGSPAPLEVEKRDETKAEVKQEEEQKEEKTDDDEEEEEDAPSSPLPLRLTTVEECDQTRKRKREKEKNESATRVAFIRRRITPRRSLRLRGEDPVGERHALGRGPNFH